MQSMNTSSTGSKLRIPQQCSMTVLQTKILSLEEMPLRYGIPQFEPCITAQLHRMLVDNYSVFYIVRGETVIVTDVLYSASDLETRLGTRHESKTD